MGRKVPPENIHLDITPEEYYNAAIEDNEAVKDALDTPLFREFFAAIGIDHQDMVDRVDADISYFKQQRGNRDGE